MGTTIRVEKPVRLRTSARPVGATSGGVLPGV
jgi:hypothetical protein